jgi:sugar phosphate isomerase/epimerase
MRLGISTAHFEFEGWDDALARAQEMGFDFIEVFAATMTNEEASAIAALGEKSGMAATYHAPFAGKWDLGVTDPRFGGLLLRSAVEQARMMAARYLIVHPGRFDALRPDGRRQALEQVIGIVESCVPALEAGGIALCLENNTSAHHPNELADRPADFERLFAALPACVGMNLDFGHAHITGNTDAYLRQFVPRLRYAHLADNHGERDEHLAPGQGTINWSHIAAACAAAGFRGPFCAEFPAADLEAAQPHLQPLLGDRTRHRDP